jgi:para-nitrobenzyl esterase
VGRVDYGSFGIPDIDETRNLAARTHASWVSFAASGEPGWLRHTPAVPITQLIEASWTMTSTPDGPERALWKGFH